MSASDTLMFEFEVPLFPSGVRGGVRECAHKFHEEAAEAMVEACAWDKTGGGRELAMDEIADSLQALANLLDAMDATEREFSSALARCVERNAARGRYDVPEDIGE